VASTAALTSLSLDVRASRNGLTTTLPSVEGPRRSDQCRRWSGPALNLGTQACDQITSSLTAENRHVREDIRKVCCIACQNTQDVGAAQQQTACKSSAGRAHNEGGKTSMRALIRFSAVAAALTLTSFVGPGAITTASAQRCGHAPTCAGLHGNRLETCMGQRAKAEADCQLHGRGDARNNPGRGPKYRKCKDTASEYGVDSATTNYRDDC